MAPEVSSCAQMAESITVDGETYFICDGRVCNVPAGPGGRRTTVNMQRKAGQVVETVAAFQHRVRGMAAKASEPSYSTPITRTANESGQRITRERRPRCSGASGSGSNVSSRPSPYGRPRRPR